MRHPQKEVPRWRRPKQAAPAQIRLSPGQQRRLVAQVSAAAGAQPTAGVVVHGPASVVARAGFRWRYHLIPGYWLAGMLAAGFGCHAARDLPLAVILGVAAAAAAVMLTRHLRPFPRHAAWAMAGLTAVWVPLIAAFGKPAAAFTLITWLAVTQKWVRHYRWRPQQPQPEPDLDDYAKWNALAAEQKWRGHLGPREELPGGGRRYPVQLDGIKTTISRVLSASENVAGAWHKPMTEAYAERDPHGITSRGHLTILGRETLMKPREWNGAGIDPATGLVVAGRYADGSPVHLKILTPRYGTRHALISGTTGSGKSALLDLICWIAITSGIVPVILDPQEGQSLPFWRDRCLYAAGTAECMATLAGLHAGMLDRSAWLAALEWDDEGIPMRGMPFFDRDLTGLPPVLIIFDEAHMLLTGESKLSRAIVGMTVEIGRLGRKTGVALWLATHLPSLSELGGEQALRDMLRGGNVVSMRTANTVAAGMLGLVKDPSEIPMFFRDGKETYGLGYAAGPDNRPDAPMRTDYVPRAMRARVPPVPALDARFAAVMDRAMRKAVIAPVPASPGPAGPSDDDAPEGRTAADAVLAVLAGEMEKGEILAAAGRLVRDEWHRDRPFHIRTMNLALEKLAAEGRIVRVRHGVYRPALVAVK
jgi:hypothetical protein